MVIFYRFLLSLGLLQFYSTSFSAQLTLSESVLKSYLKEGVPQYDRNYLQQSHAEAGSSMFNDQYTTGLLLEADLRESDDPRESIWSKQAKLGVNQKLPFGVSGGLAYIHRREKFGSLLPPPYFKEAYYAPVLGLSMEFDLWKNLFGSLERAQRNHLKSLINQTKLGRKLGEKQLHNSLRALYWRLVVQDRRIQIYRDLVTTAKRSYRNMQSRQRDGVADRGSVANMAANLSGAEANYRRAKIDRNFLERDLKVLVPSLQRFDIAVKDRYGDVRKAVAESVTCSRKVGRMMDIPYRYTEYDELIGLIEGSSQWKLKELEAHDSFDLKLNFEGRGFGLDQDLDTAIEQPFGLEETAYAATLTLTYPLGNLSRTEKLRIDNQRRQTSIDKLELSAKFAAAHSNVKKNFTPLAEAVDLYHKSINDQEKAFKFTQRKFRQGRISVFDFIGSQDTLLNTKLQVLGLEERLIMEMLNYYSIFNQAPCTFNRK